MRPFPEQTTGQITFTADGWMCIHNERGEEIARAKPDLAQWGQIAAAAVDRMRRG